MIVQFANSKLRRPLCNFSAALMLTLGLPMNLFAHDPTKPVEVKKETAKKVETRKLSDKEMETLSGRYSGNPYYAGQAKFDVVYKGVNLRTGNYSTSATDLSFEGGYGIPVNITRSYSANNIDEGPFGVGWTLSADLRSTAGGLLKSSKAPVRSVPVGMKRRPSSETDPNIPTQPVEAVVVTDSDGKETTIQRDVDGILTSPPWDKNEYETEYEYVNDGAGNLYWILKSNKTMTPDGTVYQYEKKGHYPNGSKPWNDSNAVAEPNNVLKPVWVQDRHGNQTNYVYGTTDVQFQKSNGLVYEKPLVGVTMPNGRNMEFTWSGNRVTQIRAFSTGEERKVVYGYTGGQISSVQQVRTFTGQSPQPGRITRYGYSGGLLSSMTDPRGLTSSINYYYAPNQDAMRVKYISEPGDKRAYFGGIEFPDGPGYVYSQVTQYYTAPFPGQYSVPGDHPTHMYFLSGQGIVEVATEMFIPSEDSIYSEYRKYREGTMDLIEVKTFVDPPAYSYQSTSYDTSDHYGTITQTEYNFFGNPLREVRKEYDIENSSWILKRESKTATAYWGENKYFQQKAVKVTAGNVERTSYTDYYDSSAAQGSKGQTYRVYDTKHAQFTNVGVAPPHASEDPQNNYAWKYTIVPSDLNKYSAQFQYDSKGRPTQVWKLQKVVGGVHQYVRTLSGYGADGAPAYGNATQVTEDYMGSSPRTTETLAFDLMGKAIQTRDGMGRTYSTSYDTDGNVLSVDQGAQNVVSYTYGTTDGTAENGQPLSITDGLSGVEQTISYIQSGGTKGLPLSVSEGTGGTPYSTTEYGYNSVGERLTSTITTPNGTTKYRYGGYLQVGFGYSPQRVFTLINKQKQVGGIWEDSTEEVRYKFEVTGRLKRVDFAPTPQDGQTNYNLPAKSFASAIYDYDAGGRTLSVKHYWNQLNTTNGTYNVEAIKGATAAFGHPLGLKTSTTFLSKLSSGSPSWSVDRTETYAYDADFDYLTSVDYNDGLANEVQSWGYDAAGNRVSDSAKPGTWIYDNLNRMGQSPMASYTHDAVGNRLTKVSGGNTTSYGWDAVNRMIESGPLTGSRHHYTYRADGMRVRKEIPGLVEKVYYDGQMPVETFEDFSTGSDKLTRNFVGARGLR
ncbi:hypothetical protein CCB80_02110 [Armatimonadetes bacterium Uphvl-Ar1]|nr:hypothetical protein CCB80_02110 [Armatimonadetes bacterium Uphvl-Ar1]